MYKLNFYVPESHLEHVKNALFAKGAGQYKDYDQCCWQTQGIGQFRPLLSSKPYLGKTNQLATVPEYKVEMLCGNEDIKQVVRALIDAHPYEQPAYEVHPILEIDDL